MGCNGSKKADIVRDRQRVGAGGGGGERVASAAAEGARSAAVGIGAVALGGENGAVGQYGKSWTEEHLAEQDFLKAVLERTQR